MGAGVNYDLQKTQLFALCRHRFIRKYGTVIVAGIVGKIINAVRVNGIDGAYAPIQRIIGKIINAVRVNGIDGAYAPIQRIKGLLGAGVKFACIEIILHILG